MSVLEMEAFFDDVVEEQMQDVGIAGVTLSVVFDGDVLSSRCCANDATGGKDMAFFLGLLRVRLNHGTCDFY